jgi:hypothetical protein
MEATSAGKRPVLAWRAFRTYEPFISLILKFFGGRSKPRILNQWLRGRDFTRDPDTEFSLTLRFLS